MDRVDTILERYRYVHARMAGKLLRWNPGHKLKIIGTIIAIIICCISVIFTKPMFAFLAFLIVMISVLISEGVIGNRQWKEKIMAYQRIRFLCNQGCLHNIIINNGMEDKEFYDKLLLKQSRIVVRRMEPAVIIALISPALVIASTVVGALEEELKLAELMGTLMLSCFIFFLILLFVYWIVLIYCEPCAARVSKKYDVKYVIELLEDGLIDGKCEKNKEG